MDVRVPSCCSCGFYGMSAEENWPLTHSLTFCENSPQKRKVNRAWNSYIQPSEKAYEDRLQEQRRALREKELVDPASRA